MDESDRKAGALHEHVRRRLVQLIDDTHTLGLEKLPSERALAEELRTSRSTLRRALEELERRGAIRRVRGRAGGAYLTTAGEEGPVGQVLLQQRVRKVVRSMNSIVGLPQLLTEQGYGSETRVVSMSLEPASSDIAEHLQIAPGSTVASLLRIRYADGHSLSLERMYLDVERFPDILENALNGSVYDLLATRYSCHPRSAQETLEFMPADSRVSSLLAIPRGSALIAVRRQSHDENDRPIESSIDLFRADRTRFVVDIADI